jgi:hypothetical protein
MSKEIILWSKATVFLSTLKLIPSAGNLKISFPQGAPQGTLVSLDEVRYEDIRKANSTFGTSIPNIRYMGGEPNILTRVQRSWDLTSTGSGDLTAKAIFDWEFAALPWARPDATAEGPDNIIIDILINHSSYVGHYQLNPGATALPINMQNGQITGPKKHFGEGEIHELTIRIETNANGGWVNMPTVPAAPLNVRVT